MFERLASCMDSIFYEVTDFLRSLGEIRKSWREGMDELLQSSMRPLVVMDEAFPDQPTRYFWDSADLLVYELQRHVHSRSETLTLVSRQLSYEVKVGWYERYLFRRIFWRLCVNPWRSTALSPTALSSVLATVVQGRFSTELTEFPPTSLALLPPLMPTNKRVISQLLRAYLDTHRSTPRTGITSILPKSLFERR